MCFALFGLLILLTNYWLALLTLLSAHNHLFMGRVNLLVLAFANHAFAGELGHGFLGKLRMARCAVPLLSPVSRLIVAQDAPASRSEAILARSTTTCGLPSRFPLAHAFRRPALTRSAIRLRSNSATAPKTVKTMRPAGVAVSSDSDRLTNSMPKTQKVSSARKRWLTLRAKRSNFQTAITSKRRLWASAISRSSSGRRSFAPEIPVSTYSPVTVHPRRSQYSRSSRVCIVGSCPLFAVETLP